MSLRISTKLDFCVGVDNDLTKKLFGGSSTLSTLLDTLEHGESATYRLDGAETQALSFGDVAEARMIYIEGDGEFSIALAAAAATSAQLTGVGGTYPTAFAGGEILDLVIDGTPVAVTFDVADQTRDQVVARINYTAALAGFLDELVAFATGAQLLLRSPTTGPSSEVEVAATSDVAVLTALGLTATTDNGDAAEPGTTDIQVLRPADPDGAQAALGVPSWFFGTVSATAIQVTNLMPDAELNLRVFIGGDLVATP